MIYLIIVGSLLYFGVCFEVINQITKNYSSSKLAIFGIAFIWPILLFLFLGSLIANVLIKFGSNIRKYNE